MRLAQWRSRYRLFEEIAKLIFAKFRRARGQINASKLSGFGPLPGIQQQKQPIRTPRNRVASAVSDEAHLPRVPAGHGRNKNILEEFFADRHIGDPFAVGRPDEWPIRTQWRPLEMRTRNAVFFL